MMNKVTTALGFSLVGALLMIAEPNNLPDSLFNKAEAVIGRPLTPISYAGVARRTTRRTVYAASAAPTTVVVTEDNSYEQQQAAQAQQQAAEAQQQAALAQQQAAEAQQQASLPVGATLPSLPPGCGSTTVNNQSYFHCGGNWYRPAMQNGNIVYAVVANPS
jgi:hypothetical protein